MLTWRHKAKIQKGFLGWYKASLGLVVILGYFGIRWPAIRSTGVVWVGLGRLLPGCLDYSFLVLYGLYNIGAKNLTFWRGPEDS